LKFFIDERLDAQPRSLIEGFDMKQLQGWLNRFFAGGQVPAHRTEATVLSSPARKQMKGSFICRGNFQPAADVSDRLAEVLLLGTDGKFISKLAQPVAGERISTFAVSPNRRWVAYTCYVSLPEVDEPLPQIRAASIDGQKTCPLTRWDERFEPCYLNPVFSPRGDRLACEFALKHVYNPNLMTLELDEIGNSLYGGRKTDILNPMQIGNYAPHFLPDGERIVYLSNYAYEDLLEVCLYDPSRARVEMYGFVGERLTEQAHGVWRRPKAIAVQPEWEQVFFIRGHTLRQEQICVFALADIPSGAVLKKFTAIGGEYDRIGSLQISPDGQWLTFDGDDSVYVIATDGSNLRQVTPDDMTCRGPAFSHDGTRLAFVSEGKILTVGFDGDQLMQLSGDELIIEEFVWM
jgi:hypothetical protein